MDCREKAPEACFDCPYDDCIYNGMPTRAETKMLEAIATSGKSIEQIRQDKRNYNHTWWANLTDEQKESNRARSREWYRKKKNERKNEKVVRKRD